MKLYTTIVALLMITKRTTGCDTMLNNLYSPEGGILNFSFSVTVPSGVANYQVSKQGGGSILIFGCNAGNIIPGSLIKDSDVDITGNLANGDISFSLKNVVSEDGSNYTVTDLGTGTVILCVTAYVGGELVAALPNVDPVEKDSSVTLTCNTTSTTKPSDLGITYVWTYGSVNVTSLIGRFSFLGNTFTISKIKQTDDKKVVTCTAQEAVSGLTAISNPISIIYKEPCCCKTVVCWILVIVAVVLIILLVVIHICLIECEVSELAITDLNCRLFGIRALLPGCIICILTVIIHIIVYFGKLDDDDCDTVECLVLPLIVKVLSAAGGLVIIAIYVYIRGKKGRPGNEKDDSEGPTCFGGNNSILPICGDLGSTQKDGRQRSTHGVTLATKTTHPPDNSSKFRPQPPLPGIKSEKTTGNPSPIPESGNKTRLDPIGQETQPRYEDASDSQSGEKKKKKKKKRRSKEGEEGGANVEGISE